MKLKAVDNTDDGYDLTGHALWRHRNSGDATLIYAMSLGGPAKFVLRPITCVTAVTSGHTSIEDVVERFYPFFGTIEVTK